MGKSLSGYRATVLIGWVALGAVGILYARLRSVPGWAAWPSLAAFLIVYPFYLVPGFVAARERIAGRRLPLFLLASTTLPYLACCLGAIPFRWISLLELVALALGMGLWYFILPRGILTDAGFLAVIAAALLSGLFKRIYPEPYDHVEISVLGGISVYLNAVLVLMLARRIPEAGYGFWPTAREWRIGALHFLYFLPVGMSLALATGMLRLSSPGPAWVIAGTFFGYLWVAALAIEFLFWGVLQPWMQHWTGNATAALAITAVVFGLVHLPFRGFPNWRWFVVTTILGFCCGRARNQAGGIRAAVVTHVLVVTAWRVFFNG